MKYSIRSVAACAVCSWAMLAIGCGGSAASKVVDKTSPEQHAEQAGHDHAAHAHAEEGPHHGQLIELGKEAFHLELTHDDATHSVTIYVLDAAAKESVPVAEKELAVNLMIAGKPVQFLLPAKPQATDPAGKASCFALADEKLCDGWDATGTTGRINITINEKPYVGKLTAHTHEGEHKH